MISRRGFMGSGAALLAVAGCASADGGKKKIQGLDERDTSAPSDAKWVPFSDGKVRIGIAGEGVCAFGSAFGYQKHPNAEVVACTDLDPKKCAALQQRTGAKKTYPSCEEMIRNASADKLDAVYIATDAPSHARLAIMALEHGLNVVSAVPAFFGREQLDLVPKMIDAAKASGKLYQMNETSAYRPECYAMRRIFEAGGFGEHVYTEGEYFHYWDVHGIPSYRNWRKGLPPQYYPTHSNGFYTCATHGSFTEVTCIGVKSDLPDFKDAANAFKNPYGSEIALFKTSDGGAARMAVVWGAAGYGAEIGRMHGTKGSYFSSYKGREKALVDGLDLRKPPLPPGLESGGHGGSHVYLTDDFLRGILVPGHKICVDMKTALDTTISGVYAHLSAMKGGETLKVPQIEV